MPNIASVLKQEIARVARKQTRAETAALRKANSQYRHNIADLKRRVDELSRQVTFLTRQEKKRTLTTEPSEPAEGKRFSVRGLKTHRKKLRLSAAEYASLLGVSGQTIYNWETRKSRPRPQQLAALVQLRGLGKRDAEKRLEMLKG